MKGELPMTQYLLNAFSLQMLKDFPATVSISEVKTLPDNLTSAVGHPDTAAILGVECNRLNVDLNPGDRAYVAQLQGGRLPEHATTLPEGVEFKYYEVMIR
jgi:hypothetical protein